MVEIVMNRMKLEGGANDWQKRVIIQRRRAQQKLEIESWTTDGWRAW